MNNDLHFSSTRDDWETPPELFDRLDAEFGFTLDAAASAANTKVDRFFTLDEDGLTQTWQGIVRCNPPYARGVLARWAEKAIRSSAGGATVVLLVPARTDAVWFQQLLKHAEEVRYLAGRVTFVGAPEPAPFPSAIVVLRPTRTWKTDRDRLTFTMPKRHTGPRWIVMRRID